MADDATSPTSAAAPVDDKKDDEPVAAEHVEKTGRETTPAKEAEAEAEKAEGDAAPVAAAAGEDATKTEEGASATPGAGGRRKSIGKGALGKKKSVANLKTYPTFKAGDIVLARLKGFAPWPAIILSDELAELQTELWKTKPKSAAGDDASRKVWPVAYLHNVYETNWIQVPDLSIITDETIAAFKSKGQTKAKATLKEAYAKAEEKMTLDEVKETYEAGAAISAEEPEDVDMEDPSEEVEGEEGSEEEAPKKKGGKKRKQTDDEDEEEKPAKTPKRAKSTKSAAATPKTPKAKTPKAAANGKTPKGSTKKTPAKKTETPAKGKKSKKSKETISSDDDAEASASPAPTPAPKKGSKKGAKGAKAVTPPPAEETEEEARERKNKEVLGLRHRLQKGFLTRGEGMPNGDEMAAMNVYLKRLEEYEDLDGETIKTAKINKVLKMISKLKVIAEDETYNFRERALKLYERCNATLGVSDDKKSKGAKGGSEPAEDAADAADVADEKKDDDKEDVNGEKADEELEKKVSEVTVQDKEEKKEEDVEMGDAAAAEEEKKEESKEGEKAAEGETQ